MYRYAGEQIPAAAVCQPHDESEGDELRKVTDAEVTRRKQDGGDGRGSWQGHVLRERREKEAPEYRFFQNRCQHACVESVMSAAHADACFRHTCTQMQTSRQTESWGQGP